VAGPGALPIVASGRPGEKDTETENQAGESGFSTNQFYVEHHPSAEEYATVEAITNGVPVWSFSNLCYIYGVSPDLMPGTIMQEGNSHPLIKIQPKKSWEIKHNLCGATFEIGEPRTPHNDSEPFLPVHLIDGDPNTVWSSWEFLVPDARPEWIRIDLPMESQVASVALVCAKDFNPRASIFGTYGDYGKALPKEVEIRTSRDAWHWETVYTSKSVAVDQPRVDVQFAPRPVKQIWIIGNNFPKSPPTEFQGGKRHMFSIGEVEVRDPSGTNLAVISRGASVTVSSTSYTLLGDRFSAEAFWLPLQCDLGNKWVRVAVDNGTFMWHLVEHEKGKVEIDPRADESITECGRHGINVIMGLDFKGNRIYDKPPRKANWLEARYRELNDSYDDPPGRADANPEMHEAYLRYVEYMVGHFKDRVTYFEIANEWNGMPAEQYVGTWFEPIYKIIKQIAPNAKVMLGNVGPFDRNAILDCLGRQRKTGIQQGKLWLDAGAVTPAEGDMAGAVVVREDVQASDVTVSIKAENKGQGGILLRYKDASNYLAALYAAPQHSLMIYEVVKGNWGKPLARKEVPDFGDIVNLEAKVEGSAATFMISDSKQSASTNCTLDHTGDSGMVGLILSTGDAPQAFGNFLTLDAQGKTLVKDDFVGADGTIPTGWKYITGGPNPIKPGIGARIDALGWHPIEDPSAAYFSTAREFQKQCRGLGFKGEFLATEIYSGQSFYPPGPSPSTPNETGALAWNSPARTSSETVMAKEYAKSLVGHNGLGMEAGMCEPYLSGFTHPVALVQPTWPTQTLNPCRPTMAYYVWRSIATVTDDIHHAELEVRFIEEKGLLFFGFRRGENERLLSVWIDGPSKDGIVEKKTEIVFPGLKAQRASVLDIMNGTEQDLDFAVSGSGTIVQGMLIKDYPIFVRLLF
jgi:hypothetical protein